MTEKMQADDVQSREAVFVRCCLIIKEHFSETKVTAFDLIESAIKYEKRNGLAEKI